MAAWLNPYRKLGIVGKFVIPVVLLLVVSNVIIVALTKNQLDEQLLVNAHKELSKTSELQGSKFQSDMRELVADVRFLAGTPPLAGMIRAEQNAGLDQLDNSSMAAWENRLAVIFRELMGAKPQLAQLRLLNAQGQEMVRIDRYQADGGIRRVESGLLQDKVDRDYFLEAMALGEDDVYLSNIDLNREKGQIVQPEEATIRAAFAVRRPDGSVFGVVVINRNLNPLFARLGEFSEAIRQFKLSNAQGDYLVHSSNEKAFRFEYGERSNMLDDYPFQAFFNEQDRLVDSGRMDISGLQMVYVLKRFIYGPDPSRNQIVVLASDSYETALLPSTQLMRRTLLFLLIVLLLSGILAFAAARQISNPVVQMRDVISRKRLATSPEDLPLDSRGEVGDLARAFGEFIEELHQRRRKLEGEIQVRQQAEKNLQEKNAKLSQANYELEQFAYVASHDLQEPLRTLRSFIALFTSKYGDQFDDQAKTFLTFMDSSALRMSDLVKGLLDYSRLGKETEHVDVDCGLLVDQVCQDLGQRIIESKGVVTHGNLPTVLGSPLELRMLFQNLITNALKFCAPGVIPEVKVDAHKNGSLWVFSVTDNGIGIEPQYRQRIFLIFQRLHTRDKYQGTGIGLAHCKKIVEAHGGEIWVESEAGRGSRFYFSLKE